MFRFLRNVHLALSAAFLLAILIFAVSSVVFVHRPWFPKGTQRSAATKSLPLGLDAAGVAEELARATEVRGDVRGANESDGSITFAMVRPGTRVEVAYAPSTGGAELDIRRFGAFEASMHLHASSGLRHDFLPATLWGAMSLAASLGLIVLGATGVYLWYMRPRERRIGAVLLALGVGVPLAALVLIRMQGG